MQQFPNVFGAVDGTLIQIQAPVEHEDQFVDRKTNHSLNVQVSVPIIGLFIYRHVSKIAHPQI